MSSGKLSNVWKNGVFHHQLTPTTFLPPLCVVGYMSYTDFIKNFVSGLSALRTAILNNAQYYVVGSLEVGATITGEPKVLSIPVFEGETQYSNISQYLMGHSVTLRCKVNLFSDTDDAINAFIGLSKITNTGTALIKGDVNTLYEQGFIGYFYSRLATKMYAANGNANSNLYLFGLVNVLGQKEYEFFILLNPHVSMPAHVFPVGGTPATLSLDVFSDGPGLAIHRYCKLGAGIVSGPGVVTPKVPPAPVAIDSVVAGLVFGRPPTSGYTNIVDDGLGAHGGNATFKFKDMSVGNHYVCDQMIGVAPYDANIIAVFGTSSGSVFRSNYSIVTF